MSRNSGYLLLLAALLTQLLVGCKPLSAYVRVKADVQPQLPLPRDFEPLMVMGVDRDKCVDGPRIAVVDVDGILLDADPTGPGSAGENPVSVFRERLDCIAADHCVKAVVVRINSPGGSVTATDIMWHDLKNFKANTQLPIIACLMDVGAGGAYYLATAADQIVAHPTSVTGGIGVILNVYNLQDAMAQFNIVGVPIKAGKNVDIGTPIKAIDDDRRKLLQTMADEFHQRFRQVVSDSRRTIDATQETNFDGRVFTARQALERHLIDTIGYLDDAIGLGRQISGNGTAVAVLYHRNNDPAHTPYAITPNIPLQVGVLPVSMPGFDRSKLPSFLYLWQPEPTMEKMVGR